MSKILAIYTITNNDIDDILYTLKDHKFINKQNFTKDQIKCQRYILIKEKDNQLTRELGET